MQEFPVAADPNASVFQLKKQLPFLSVRFDLQIKSFQIRTWVIFRLRMRSFLGTASSQTLCQMPETGVYHMP